MEVIGLNREEACPLINTCWSVLGYNPSDVDIMDHLKLGTYSDSFDWLMPSNIFWADELPQRSTILLEPTNAGKYSWLDSEILGTLSALDNPKALRDANIKVGRPSN